MIQLLDRYEVYIDESIYEKTIMSPWGGPIHRYTDVIYIKDLLTGDECSFEYHYPEDTENYDEREHLLYALDSYLFDLITYQDYRDNPFLFMIEMGVDDPYDANRIWGQLRESYKLFTDKFGSDAIYYLIRDVSIALGEDSLNAYVD